MKLVNVSQWVPERGNSGGSPTQPKPACRLVGNPACAWSNSGCEAGGNKEVGRVSSPEICIVVDSRITLRCKPKGKADALERAEGSNPRKRMAVRWGFHRGLRPGHASTGETWELGRSDTLLEPKAGTWETGLKIAQARQRKPSATAEIERKRWLRGTGRRGYKPKPKGRGVGSLSGSIVPKVGSWRRGLSPIRSGRRRSDVQASRCREGEAGHNVLTEGNRGET